MKTRRNFLASALCAPLAIVGLAQPAKRKGVTVGELTAVIKMDTTDFDKKLEQMTAKLQGVNVTEGNLAVDCEVPLTIAVA